MRGKIHSYLGFAKRSRSLAVGYNSCIYGMERKKVKLLILAGDLSENTLEKMSGIAKAQKVPVRVYGEKDLLSEMIGEVDKGVLGITDRNLAKALLNEIDQKKNDAE